MESNLPEYISVPSKKGLFWLGLFVAFLVTGGVLFYFLKQYRDEKNESQRYLLLVNGWDLRLSDLSDDDDDDLGLLFANTIELHSGMTYLGEREIGDTIYYTFDMPYNSLGSIRSWAKAFGLQVEKEGARYVMKSKQAQPLYRFL